MTLRPDYRMTVYIERVRVMPLLVWSESYFKET